MKIDVEIGLQMVIPELQKLPEFQDNYYDYYDVYDLMVEVCDLFTEYQTVYVTKYNGEDNSFYIVLDDRCSYQHDTHRDMFYHLWKMFIPIINFSSLLEKHSIIDNSKNIDYLYEPECELRREY